MKSRTFVGWSTLMREDPFGAFGRLTALLFDEVYVQLHDDQIHRVLASAASDGTISQEVAKELEQIWKPAYRALPGYPPYSVDFVADDTGLVSTAFRVAIDATRREMPGLSRPENVAGYNHEISWATIGLVECVNVWALLNATEPCSFVANARERETIQEVFGGPHLGPGAALFTGMLSVGIPDLAAVEWSRILDLRRNSNLESFRSKVSELQRSIRSDDPHEIGGLVREIERHDLRTLARSVRPATPTSFLKGLASNVPLPIPVNPLSVGLSILEVVQAYQMRRRFGWLFFVLEATGEQEGERS